MIYLKVDSPFPDPAQASVSVQLHILRTDAATLTTALTTRYVSAAECDVWACSNKGRELVLPLSLPSSGTLGNGAIGIQYGLSDGSELPFTFEANSSNVLLTSPVDSSVVLTSTNFVFSGPDNFSYSHIGETPLNCVRQSNAVTFGTTTPVIQTDNSGPVNSSPAQEPEGFTELWAYSERHKVRNQ